MPDFSKYIPSLDLGPTALFGLLALVIVLLFALSLGRTRVLISLLSVYVAFTLQAIFPFFSKLQGMIGFAAKDLPTLRVIVFLLVYLVVFVLLNRSVFKNRFSIGESAFISVFLMALIQLGLLISIILNLAPKFYGIDQQLPKFLSAYLAGQRALFSWSVLPLIVLLFSRRPD